MWELVSIVEELSGEIDVPADDLQDLFQDLTEQALNGASRLDLLFFAIQFFNTDVELVEFDEVVLSKQSEWIEASIFFCLYWPLYPELIANRSRFRGAYAVLVEDVIRRRLQGQAPLSAERYQMLLPAVETRWCGDVIDHAKILLRFFVTSWLNDFNLTEITPDDYIEACRVVLPSSLNPRIGIWQLKSAVNDELQTDRAKNQRVWNAPKVLEKFLMYWSKMSLPNIP